VNAEPAWAVEARRALAAIGCQAWGVADGAPWQGWLPGCRAVVVVGSGGPALWRAAVARGPRPDPVDGLVRAVLDGLPPGPGRRWTRIAGDVPEQPDARTLAVAAGLGWPSRLGLVLHPTYGPWLGVRAVAFTTDPLPPTGPLAAPAPCETCAAPCATACPAAAIAPTWHADRCLPHRAAHTTCDGGCLARSACPVGAEHVYDATAHRYHQHPPSRASILAALTGPAAPDGRGRGW
jgi:hypothetical protein